MRYQRGFNLLDLLIGLAISMFAILAVAVVFRDFGQMRTTQTQTSESQNNGTMALYLLEQDLSQAGFAMMGLQNCAYINYYFSGTGYYDTPYGTASLPGDAHTALTTLPVRIIDGGTASDTIEVQYGKTVSGVAGSEISGAVTYPGDYPVSSPVGFQVGDRAVANVSGKCTLVAITRDPTAASTDNTVASPVHHRTGDPYNPASAPGGSGWNSVTSADMAATPKPYLANLGSFVSHRYAVGNGSNQYALTLAELPALDTSSTVVDEIVFVKAQYGLSATSTSTSVASWVDGTTVIDNTSAARVIAVRVGVVARSPLLEKGPVDAPATLSILPSVTTATSTLAAPSAGQCATDTGTMEVKCTVPDTHYRYRSYSTIVPLKNVIWTR